jgi:hypothetical protein
MRTCRPLLIPVLSALIWAVVSQPDRALAQERPGIRPFVNVPEGCYIADPVDTESLYSFLKVQIQALSFAKAGEKANREMLTASDGPPVERIPKVIAGLRQERIEDTCAGFVISSYAGSKNETVSAVAKVLAFAYDDMAKMTNQMLRLTLEDTRKRTPDIMTAKALSDLKDKRQELLQRTTEALNISLSLLVDATRTNPDGNPDHIILSLKERDELLDYLHAQFPNLTNEQASGSSDEFVQQAALIQSFLSGKYKPADR